MIVHIPAEDGSSLEGSDTSSQKDIKDFVNFGYAARMAAMKEQDPDEFDDIDQNMFFPPLFKHHEVLFYLQNQQH